MLHIMKFGNRYYPYEDNKSLVKKGYLLKYLAIRHLKRYIKLYLNYPETISDFLILRKEKPAQSKKK